MPLVARPSARVDGFPGEPAAAATLRPKGPTAAASAALAEMPPAAPNGPASARSSAPERPLTPPAPAPPTHSRRRGYVSPPPVIKDRRSDATYTRNGLLGEGGFARCYEILDANGARFAAKVVPKSTLKLQKNKNKLFAEIKIHQSMRHPNIVKFHHCFEDNANVYMVLELCEGKTLMEMLKRRRRFTEPEVRYYMLQILDACRYMHGNRIIHRDLKLGNLFLTAGMGVKIGDFGLAAVIRHDGERKKTICGTPNYIAPEILFDTQNGHSYEVDVWSLGVIMYTLLIGRPPFQTKDVKAIYRRIKENIYEFPPHVDLSPHAKSLIQALLSTRPEVRPSVNDITAHPFFSGFLPIGIPVSAMHTEPVFMHSATSSAPSTQEQSPFSSALYATEVVHPVGTAISRNSADAVRSSSMPDGKPPQKLEDAVGKHYYSPAMASGPFLPGPPATRSSTFPPVAKQFGVTGEPGSSPMARTVVGSGQLARVPAGVVPAPLQGQYASSTHVAGPPPVIVDAGTAEVAGHEVDTGDFRPNFAASTASAVGAPVQVRVAGNSAGRSAAFSSAAPVVPLAATTQQEVPAAAYVGLPPRAAPSCSARGAASGSGISGPAQASSGAFGTHGVLENMLLHITSALAERKNGRSEQVVAAEMGELRWRSAADVQSHAPKIFISKWIDYSNKYGLGYQLTDGSVGVYFNDSTSIVLAPDEHHFEYLYYMRGEDRTYMHRQCHVLTEHPPELTKKVTLLKHFRGYMTENLFKAPAYTFTDSCKTYDLDFLTKYLRTKHAVVFRLSNRVVQLNFFDHTKLILSLDGRLVTYIDRNREMATWTLGQVLVQNCHELLSRIRYAKDILEQLIAKRTKKSARATLAAAAVASGRVPDGGGAGRDAVDAVADRLAECRIGNSGS